MVWSWIGNKTGSVPLINDVQLHSPVANYLTKMIQNDPVVKSRFEYETS